MIRMSSRALCGLALAAAAAVLLAPGAARAQNTCGVLNSGNMFTEDCPNAAYASGIIYWDQVNAVTLTVPGTATTTTITTASDGMQDSGIAIRTNTHASDARNIDLTVGGTGPVNIEQDPDTTHTDQAALAALLANNRGIFVSQRSGNGATTTVDVKSGVTIGSSTNRMKANGLHVEVGVRDTTTGLVQAGTAGAVMITNEADIYADWNGVAVDSTGVAATATTTVINRGDITARLNGIGVTNLAPTGGAITVTNEGDIVAAVSGVGVSTLDAAATSVTNHGAITADQNGITVVKGRGAAGPITVTNSGAIESKSTSASANLFNNGILALSNGSDSAGGAKGGVSVTHSGGAIKVPSGGKGIRANVGDGDPGAGNTGTARVSVTGGSITAKGGAIEAINRRAGSVRVDVSSGVALTSTQGHGIQAHVTDAGNTAGQVEITQGGRITARTGVDAAVLRASAVGEPRAAKAQPLIDVTWTGSFSHGTTATVAPNDNDRFTASDAGGALTTHRDVEAEEAMRPMPEVGTGFLRYGSPAGIESQVMSWRDVAAKVAEGDDPGAIADGTAQMNLLSVSHADSRRTEILRAFKAALENGEIDVADLVFDAIKTGATSLEGVTDAEIVTYLEKDDDATRTLLRNVLAQSLSDEEKAVLRAVATDTRLDAALDDEDAGFSAAYKTAVKDLLDRFNVGNIRIAMNGGSINSRGDGIRAYYATPNDENGRIDLTVAEGASVTGAMAGVYVANAGMGDVEGDSSWGRALGLEKDETLTLRQQFVTVHGTVTGGTDAAVHLSGGGALLVGEKGKVHAGSSGRAILVNDPGRSEIVINGEVRGGAGARGAVDTTGGGSITVGPTGKVITNGATSAIHADYATPNDKNGAIDVTIAAGATVDVSDGGMAGIYVANAGMGDVEGDSFWGRALGLEKDETLTLRQQFVTVHGTVTGGTDAAVHLSGGGALLVGEKGKVHAGSSGRAILVNDPGRSEIVINGEVKGGSGSGADAVAAVETIGGGSITLGRTGRVVLPEGATDAIRADRATGSDATTDIILVVDAMSVHQGNANEARLGGAVVGDAVPVGGDGRKVVYFVPTTGMGEPVPLREDGRVDISGLPKKPQPPTKMAKMFCDMAMDKRCRLYEALPSMLLAMNGLPTYQERMAAMRSEAGGWARVETARGKWKAESSTVAYDRSRTGVRVGADAPVGENTRAGVSVHGLRGSAAMTQSGGKARLSGMGVGVHGTALVGDGVYVDAQAAVTRYDVELTSAQGRTLKDGASGMGYALAVEAGRPMALKGKLKGDLTLTPRAGFAWSRVSLGDFTDTHSTRVSVADAGSFMGRAGVGAEMVPEGAGGLRVFGSMDVVHEFSAETEARVMGTALKASAKSTGVRLGVGAVHGWAEGRYAVAGSVSYATGGGSSGEFGGGLSLTVRF